MLTLAIVGVAGYLAGIGSVIGVVWWAKRKMLRSLKPAGPLVAPPGFKLKSVKGGGR